jgi:3-oxoacyl-[acyl-carrier protein] reductase
MVRLSKLSRSVAGKVVIVTGAASGMGRATAHLFADEGALVAATDISPIGPVIDEIVARRLRVEPVGAPERLASPFLHGFNAMPVRLEQD